MKYHEFKIRLIGRIDPITVVAISFEAAEADVMETYANAEIQTMSIVSEV